MGDSRTISAKATALAVLRAYVCTYIVDKTGREAPDRSRLLALDALETLEKGKR